MTINLSIRNYRITIGGLDCTPAIVSFQGSDSKLDQSGLIIFSGTIVLGRPDGFETLDDRKNNRWSRGQAINIQIADTSGTLRPSPRGGKLFILDSQFDLKTRKLTLHVGDIFELLKIKEPKGDASKICVGTSTSRTEVVKRLLVAAGAPSLVDEIAGFLNSPTPRLLEGSFIEQAGAIAAAAGYFLWVDSSGQVRASQINTKQALPLIAIDLVTQSADYQRLEGEQPAERIIINGKATIVRQTKDGTETLTEEFGPASITGSDSESDIIVKRSYMRDSFSRASKVRTIETTIEQPAGLVVPDDPDYKGATSLVVSEYRKETYEYETNAPITGFVGQPGCQQGNQGRLKTHKIETLRPRMVVYRDVYSSFPQDDDGRLEINIDKFELVVAQIDETSYVYNPGQATLFSGTPDETDLPLLEPLGRGPRILRTSRQPIGAIIPAEFAYDPDRIAFNMERLALSELETQFWKEKSFGEWSYEQTVLKPLAIAYPQVADRLRERRQADEINYQPSALVRLVEVQDTTTISRSGQAQPPAPETYSPPFTTEEVTVKGKAAFPVDITSPYRPRTRSLTFEYLSAIGTGQAALIAAQTEADRLAQLWGAILWGRYKGASIITELQDAWFDYQPLSRGDVEEPDGVAAYLMDGFAIAMAEKRCTVAFDGILLGWTQAENLAQIAPLYRQTQEVNLMGGSAVSYQTVIRTADPVSRRFELQGGGAVSYRLESEISKIEVQGGGAVSFGRSFASLKVQGGASTAWARSISWDEITPEIWLNMTAFQWERIYPPNL